jgi:hypothetical protein
VVGVVDELWLNKTTSPQRQVRAQFDDETLTVYQAFPPHIADAAVDAGTFVSPFKLDRMTWIKPSFLWMMYRSGYATTPGQERILAVRVTRAGFEQGLAEACLSHYDPDIYPSHNDWLDRKRTTSVRVQWDPERTLRLEPLPWRTIQIGISGTAVRDYVTKWIHSITDVTQTAHDLRELLREGDLATARDELPSEEPYPLPPVAALAVGIRPLGVT